MCRGFCCIVRLNVFGTTDGFHGVFPVPTEPGKPPQPHAFMPISANVTLGQGVQIFQPDLVNLYGCTIGDETKIGAFVEVQKNASIGKRCKISSHTFVCEGVTIEDDVFVGHGVMFINDLYPRATADGRLQTEADWQVVPTLVKRGSSLGSGAVILAGVTIGEGAMVGAGAVVTHDVPDHTIAKGVPARLGRTVTQGVPHKQSSGKQAI